MIELVVLRCPPPRLTEFGTDDGDDLRLALRSNNVGPDACLRS